MGYWDQNEKGHSFEGGMTWGDEPADIMGEAVRDVAKAFQRDVGRSPTEEEVKAGLLFSLSSALADE